MGWEIFPDSVRSTVEGLVKSIVCNCDCQRKIMVGLYPYCCFGTT